MKPKLIKNETTFQTVTGAKQTLNIKDLDPEDACCRLVAKSGLMWRVVR